MTAPFPARADCVLRDLLARRAETASDRVFAIFDDGCEWSFEETAERAWACAQAFVDLGIARDIPLVAWLPNGKEALLAWFGAAAAGITYTPLNTGLRGRILEEALSLVQARALVAHASLLSRLVGLDLPDLELLVVVGDVAGVPAGLPRVVAWDAVVGDRRAPAPPVLARPVEPWDDQMVMFTSGTTGASKAVRRPHVLYLKMAEATFDNVGVTADDRFLVCAPMFHGGADVPIYAMLKTGGSVAIVRGFRTEDFWRDVRRWRCTVAWIHSAMCMFLWQQPPRPDDRDHPLRLAMQAPLLPEMHQFAERFGIHLYTVYGMTEMPCVFSLLDPVDHRSLGRPWTSEYEVRLADEHDREVPDGSAGELIVRHQVPWAVTPGYYRQPEATAQVWRNGWFHSGDVLVRDASGEYRLVDRAKDSIRRRGENVSSAEVERELLAHPAVAEAAVVGVPAEIEQDVMAVVVRSDELAPEDVIAFLAERLPYFAVPRYVEFVERIERNAALRPDKNLLRKRGVTAATWDREAAGLRIRRERL
jgi:crotonobetaine/carnitine-CoA ligase